MLGGNIGGYFYIMKHLSLFSGIGGFDLAAQWMGWDNIAHCEWNPFGRKILNYYWPNAISYEDITKTDFTIHRGTIDIVTGGFPCQPYSVAGKRKGKEDERHLWPEMLRAIREIQPSWVVGENVRGLVSWNDGMVFNEVQTDMEAIGYKILTFILPACGVNAPHRRDRIWFVAYSEGERVKGFPIRKESTLTKYGINGDNGTASDAENKRCLQCPYERKLKRSSTRYRKGKSSGICKTITYTYSRRQSREKYRKEKSGQPTEKSFSDYWTNFPTQSPICDGNDGFSYRLDGITFSKWRNESIKAGGNAIVPQVAYQIFKAIEQYNAQETN